MNDRVVCVMSVGAGKYRKQYELVRDNLMAYAKKCHADFRFIDDYIDKDKKRDIYSQKLLIPDYLREYEQVLFLDLDIIISPDCLLPHICMPLYRTDSAPSAKMTVIKFLALCPRTRAAGALLFRHAFLLLPFPCACHIRKTTLKARNLYQNMYHIVKINIALSTTVVNNGTFDYSSKKSTLLTDTS